MKITLKNGDVVNFDKDADDSYITACDFIYDNIHSVFNVTTDEWDDVELFIQDSGNVYIFCCFEMSELVEHFLEEQSEIKILIDGWQYYRFELENKNTHQTKITIKSKSFDKIELSSAEKIKLLNGKYYNASELIPGDTISYMDKHITITEVIR